MKLDLTKLVIKKYLRVPAEKHANILRAGEEVARKLDIALMKSGFKLSGDLFKEISSLVPVNAYAMSKVVLESVAELVGDSIKHNVYFKQFPINVPDTEEFWMGCLISALGIGRGTVLALRRTDNLNLLELPEYGRYLHSYDEMVQAHSEFEQPLSQKFKILHLGDNLRTEVEILFGALAGSQVPLNGDDRVLLANLAENLQMDAVDIPVRENRAIINAARIKSGRDPLVTTINDVLRLACAISDGDVTLTTKTKFKKFSRAERRILCKAISDLNKTTSVDWSDVNRYSEQWKRFGSYLHPKEHDAKYPFCTVPFTQAHKLIAKTRMSKVNTFMKDGEVTEAVQALVPAPGMFVRNLDWMLRNASSIESKKKVFDTLRNGAEHVSGRVLLSLAEHMRNRTSKAATRVFSNSKGKTFVTPDTRKPITLTIAGSLDRTIMNALKTRMRQDLPVVIDPDMLEVAIPLSEKNKLEGFSILPRGTVSEINGDILRFFVYWKQKTQRTDYDLSVLFLDKDLKQVAQLSWTWLSGELGVHSGDIIEAPNGASEFIDVRLSEAAKQAAYIVPTVNVFCGDSFKDAEECFFGFMERESIAKIKPRVKQVHGEHQTSGKSFEPAAVKMKSDLRGDGGIAMPVVFFKDSVSGNWQAKWLHMFSEGLHWGNRVEQNRVSTAMIAKGIIDRRYITVSDIAPLLGNCTDCTDCHSVEQAREMEVPILYIGMEAVEGLPEGSKQYTPANLKDLIPA